MTFILMLVLIPRNLFVGLMLLYRKLISPLYGNVCRYYPSCSAYALGSFQQLGVVRGLPISGWRVLRCNPWSEGGIDDVKAGPGWIQVTELGFVIPKKKG
jgi:putative membrane protein insertion efficiency factor